VLFLYRGTCSDKETPPSANQNLSMIANLHSITLDNVLIRFLFFSALIIEFWHLSQEGTGKQK
jgi:hypothetical protein